MRSAVITGATGMIGRALCLRLIKTGWQVCALVNPDSGRMCGIGEEHGVRRLPMALEQYKAANVNDIGPCDAFFHLAWIGTNGSNRLNPLIQMRNIEHTLDAVALANRLGCSVFIGAGSQAEYGRFDGAISPNHPSFPDNAYGSAKLCAGQLSRFYCNDVGMRHIWARIFSVYGPYDNERTLVSYVIRSILMGNVPELTKCDQVWDYLFCEDAARALELIAEKGVDGSIYCIGGGKALPLRDYVEEIRTQIDCLASVGYGKIPYADSQVMHLEADISSLRADTGFYPKVSFKEGISQTIDWWRSVQL